jgi:hypothetical protein
MTKPRWLGSIFASIDVGDIFFLFYCFKILLEALSNKWGAVHFPGSVIISALLAAFLRKL